MLRLDSFPSCSGPSAPRLCLIFGWLPVRRTRSLTVMGGRLVRTVMADLPCRALVFSRVAVRGLHGLRLAIGCFRARSNWWTMGCSPSLSPWDRSSLAFSVPRAVGLDVQHTFGFKLAICTASLCKLASRQTHVAVSRTGIRLPGAPRSTISLVRVLNCVARRSRAAFL